MPFRAWAAALGAILVCLAARAALAAPGDLDPALLGGRAHTDFHGFFDQAETALVQPDGTVVVAGQSRRQTGTTGGGIPLFRQQLALARYTAVGALDPGFGDQGRVETDFGVDVDVRTLVRDPGTGDLIAVGNTISFPQTLVYARYDAGGTPDPGVGGGTGRVVSTIPGFAFAALARAGGKVLVGGRGRNTSGFDAFLLARFAADGTPDPTFDTDGFVISNQGAAIFDMVAVPGDEVVVAGWVNSSPTGGFRNFVAARFDDVGAPDMSFGGDNTGRIAIDFFNDVAGDEARAITRASDGTLYVGGFANEGSGATQDRHFALARLTADGVLDGFGGTGKVTTPLPEQAMIRRLFVQSTGRVLAVGETGIGLESSTLASTRGNLALARYETTGAIDPTFGDDGTIIHLLRGEEQPRGATMQMDDEPIAVGRYREDWLVQRLLATGQADTSFGEGGRVLIKNVENLIGVSGALQPDGKILVAGRGTCQSSCGPGFPDFEMVVARHLPDGRLDGGFGDRGVAFVKLPDQEVAAAVTVQADQKIVAAGAAGPQFGADDDFAVVRLTSAGAVDGMFGTGGLATVDFFGGHDRIAAVGVQSADQKIVVAGEADGAPPGPTVPLVIALARFLPSGMPDPDFGVGGKVVTDLPGASDRAFGLLLQPDGKIVIVGDTLTETTGQLVVARYLENGDPDPDFGSNGVVTTPISGNTDGAAGVIRQGTSYIVSGYVNSDGAHEDFVVVRYLENGDVDETFGTMGFARTDVLGLMGDDEAISIAAQADGRLLAVGDTSAGTTLDFAVARYDADGHEDPSFGMDGQAVVDMYRTEDFDTRSALVQSDDRLVGVGTIDGLVGLGTTGGLGFFRMETAGGVPPTTSTTVSTSTTTTAPTTTTSTTTSTTTTIAPTTTTTTAPTTTSTTPTTVTTSTTVTTTTTTTTPPTTTTTTTAPTTTTSTTVTTTSTVTTSTTTTTPPTTTTTTTAPTTTTSTTTTTTVPPTTSTTLPSVAEICGNCLDDDRNGRTDYDDPACCAAAGAVRLRKAQLRGGPAGGRLDLETTLSGGGLATVNPTAEDLYVRLSDASGVTLLCGRVPAAAFKKRKKFFQFLDRRNVVTGDAGIDGVVVKPLRGGTLQVAVQGKRAELAAAAAGAIRVTLAFDAAGPGLGRCASVVQPFRTVGRNKGLRFP